MPALTFTADSTTNQLTITAHAFNNGDGPVTPYTQTGTLPTGSPAITALTDYWVKVDDTNHVKLATSQANALAGTTIDITANGSGTLQLLYDLPYRLPGASVTPGSQVKARWWNSQAGDTQNRIGIFNVLIAIWNLLTGQAQSIWTAVTIAVAVTFNAAVSLGANLHLTLSGTGQIKHGDRTPAFTASFLATIQSGTATFDLDGQVNYTSATVVIYMIPLAVGDRIKSIVFAATGNNTVDGNIDVRKVPSSGSTTSIIGGGTSVLTNVSSTKADVTVDCTDTTLAAGEAIVLVIESLATGLTIGNIRPTYDHP